MTNTPKRGWPRFSLRTLFVVVTVFGCWLGYELHWIHQRREAFITKRVISDDQDPFTGSVEIVPAPGLLWLFGERGHAHINVYAAQMWKVTQAEEAELQRVRNLFPEALVGPYWHEPKSPPEPELPAMNPVSPYDEFKL